MIRNCAIALGTGVSAYCLYRYFANSDNLAESCESLAEIEKKKIASLTDDEKYQYMMSQLQMGENALINGNIDRGATLIAAAISGKL